MLKIASRHWKKFRGFSSSPEAIMHFVHMKYWFSLSCRDLEEMMHLRGAWDSLRMGAEIRV